MAGCAGHTFLCTVFSGFRGIAFTVPAGRVRAIGLGGLFLLPRFILQFSKH